MSTAPDVDEGAVQEAAWVSGPAECVPPPASRFLFVDVAAMRAKQLRRGAIPRVRSESDPAAASYETPHKFERVAMKEVREGLISYQLPDAEGVSK